MYRSKTKNKKKEAPLQITDSEEAYEQLEAIRNYNKSYPNDYPNLLYNVQSLFDNMLRQPYYPQASPPKARP